MNATYLLLAILFLVVVIPEVTGWFIRRQTRSMGKFGLGPLQVSCPNCGAAQPFIRTAASFRQMMFGGYTCSRCGTEIDKFGRVQEA